MEIGGLGTPSISKDGTTIAADAFDGNGVSTAALWEGGTSWRNLGGVPGGAPGVDFRGDSLSSTWGISGDVSVVVGLAWLPAFEAHAFRWEESTGMVDLGSLNEGKNSRANAVNDDGRIVAGWDEGLTGFWRGVTQRIERTAPSKSFSTEGTPLLWTVVGFWFLPERRLAATLLPQQR